MHRRFRRELAAFAILGVAVLLAVVGAAATARGAEPLELQPDIVKAKGFGGFKGDVRKIPHFGKVAPDNEDRAAKEPKEDKGGGKAVSDPAFQGSGDTVSTPTSGASFQGLDHSGFGAGWPPDPNGDVGPNHYVQTVNTSIGIFDKASGSRVAAFTFDTLWSQAHTGTPCDNSNQGDPVALYDPFGDRFIVSDFAWTNEAAGPFYECIAVSKTGDPVNGGWWFYAWQVESGAKLPDYPKLGVWPDGIYMSANVFASSGSGSFQNVQVWAFDRVQMEAGNPAAQGVTFNLPKTVGGASVFSLLPSNARSVTGAPPAGSPNYFASIWGLYAIQVWKFAVNWANPASSTFSGPTNSAIATVDTGPSEVPENTGNDLDTLAWRLMMQNQYTNLNGTESLWLTHTVGSGGTPNTARVRWYQLPVTGGTIAGVRQQSTWGPDSSNRFMPSLAVDRNGDMAVGYSVSDANMYPAIRYSGRLAGDPLNQLTQGETTLVQGLGYQCCSFSSGATNNRWGDYSAMTIDPDGCTFWYTGEYYDAHPTTLAQDNWLTRIGSFTLPGCNTAPPPAPTVSGFSPTSGPPGTSVSVTGTNLGGATAVTFNGASAAFSPDSATQLTANVPSGATNGPIAVTTAGGTGTSAASFIVTTAPPPGPTIGGFTPTSGVAGTTVTITGTNLAGATAVAFNGTAATFTAVSATTVTAAVPATATTGKLTVTTPGGTATSAASFTVKPAISGFSPASGKAGATVTIAGSGFTGATAVAFGNKNGSFTVNGPTQITATVPSGAKTGSIKVTTPAGSATSAQKFTVTR